MGVTAGRVGIRGVEVRNIEVGREKAKLFILKTIIIELERYFKK